MEKGKRRKESGRIGRVEMILGHKIKFEAQCAKYIWILEGASSN